MPPRVYEKVEIALTIHIPIHPIEGGIYLNVWKRIYSDFIPLKWIGLGQNYNETLGYALFFS